MEPLTEDDIAHYLGNHPEFFERHAQLLAAITLTSPHSHRAVSLQERQAELLREKIRGLESRLMDMVRHGNDNLIVLDKLLRWTRHLLLTRETSALPALIAKTVETEFSVPQVAIKVWAVAPEHADAAFAQGVSDDVKVLTASLQEPFCGVNAGFEPVSWLDDPQAAASVALLPLRATPGGLGDSRTQPVVGLMVLASPDSQRFAGTMGTDFLQRIADAASAALARLV